MTGVAISAAAIVVSFVIRDIALRLMAEWRRYSERQATGAGVEQVAAALNSETARLSTTRAELATLAEKVEALAMRDSMGRGKR